MRRVIVLAALIGVLMSGCGYVMCRAFANNDEVCRQQSWSEILLLDDPWTGGGGEER